MVTTWSIERMVRDPATGAPISEAPAYTITPLQVKRATLDFAAEIRELKRPKKRSMLLSMGRVSDKLQLEGTIEDSTVSMASLEANFVLKLRNCVYHMVKLSEGTTQVMYENTEDSSEVSSTNTWIMNTCQIREVGGFTRHYEFTLGFVAGSYHRVFL